jgi:peptide/nickel transport system permease protein
VPPLEVRDLEYVQAAVVNGERDRTIMARQVLPAVLRPVTVQTTVAIPTSIVGAAILSFPGLGVQPPTADWGAMLAQAQNYLYQAPWLGVFPGVAIFTAALCFNLPGDGITDALDREAAGEQCRRTTGQQRGAATAHRGPERPVRPPARP